MDNNRERYNPARPGYQPTNLLSLLIMQLTRWDVGNDNNGVQALKITWSINWTAYQLAFRGKTAINASGSRMDTKMMLIVYIQEHVLLLVANLPPPCSSTTKNPALETSGLSSTPHIYFVMAHIQDNDNASMTIMLKLLYVRKTEELHPQTDDRLMNFMRMVHWLLKTEPIRLESP